MSVRKLKKLRFKLIQWRIEIITLIKSCDILREIINRKYKAQGQALRDELVMLEMQVDCAKGVKRVREE